MASSPSSAGSLDRFLDPLRIDLDRCHRLSHLFLANFAHLAANSRDQFLPTPISESILRPVADHGQGRHVSPAQAPHALHRLDGPPGPREVRNGARLRNDGLTGRRGGTNLRVGFVQLLANQPPGINGSASNGCSNGHDASATPPGRIQRHLEKSWPISDQLKSDNADSLFRWIGKCIADVVEEGCRVFQISRDAPLPLGVTFSFPTEQRSLSEATITSMGKGFALPPDVELGARLRKGYDKMRAAACLPPIRVVAIVNDSVATLASFIFNYGGTARRRAAMGLILGTGSNATVPLRSNMLHPSKRPQKVSILPGEAVDDVRIAVNTEWSIRGTELPMRQLGFITRWDDQLSAQNETPGFQPLEYMTAGRYLGELGRIVLLSYMTEMLGLPSQTLPPALLEAHSLTTTFLSHFKPLEPTSVLVSKLRTAFPERQQETGFAWTEHLAEALYRIAKAVELRAAGITAAGIVALLTLAEELPAEGATDEPDAGELGVGYTGGCIVHFQDYLADCQSLVDGLVAKRYGTETRRRVALSPCHDGGITGAGILVAAALSSQEARGPRGA